MAIATRTAAAMNHLRASGPSTPHAGRLDVRPAPSGVAPMPEPDPMIAHGTPGEPGVPGQPGVPGPPVMPPGTDPGAPREPPPLPDDPIPEPEHDPGREPEPDPRPGPDPEPYGDPDPGGPPMGDPRPDAPPLQRVADAVRLSSGARGRRPSCAPRRASPALGRSAAWSRCGSRGARLRTGGARSPRRSPPARPGSPATSR